MIAQIFLLAFVALSGAVPKPKSPREIVPDYPELKVPFLRGYKISNEKIVGGDIASPHAFPHQVALFLQKPTKTSFCGGSLISPKYVLTAAHCTDTAISIEVVLGAHNIRDDTEKSQIRITTSDYIIHEDYDSTTNRNDISIIKLPDGAITLSEIIRTVRLPTWGDVGKNLTEQRGVVSGWGKISDDDTSYTDYLQYVNLPVITNEECDEWYFGGTIKDDHLCTSGDNGRSSCNGDSGGALVSDGKQIGIVSFGIIFGCESGYPAAFTRVSEFLQWIQDHSDVKIRA